VGDDTGKVPCALVVMGVSGSGKSTIGDKLAERLDWTFEDGDRFHPASNVAKMTAGPGCRRLPMRSIWSARPASVP
jgi:gluconokinase